MLIWATAGLCALLGLGPPSDAAGELYAKAQESMDAQDYAAAAALLAEAYTIDPDPSYLYGRGQALRLAGDCATAIEAFESFIETKPPAQDEDDARSLIEQCRQSAPPPEATVPEPIVEAPVAVAKPRSHDDGPPARPAAERPWYKDGLGGGLLGSGLGLAALGGTLYGLSFSTAAAPGGLESEENYDRRQRRVRVLAGVGIAGLAVAAGLLTGAIIRYAVVNRANKKRRLAARYRAPSLR